MSDLSAANYNAIHQLKVNEIAQLLSLNGDQVTKLDQIISTISSTQPGGDKLYGHEVIVSVSTTAIVQIAAGMEYSITPPTGCFIRVVALDASANNVVVLKSLGAGTLNLKILVQGHSNTHQLGGSSRFRVGGSLSSSTGSNPLQYIDGAINEPIVIKNTEATGTRTITLAYQVIKIE